MSREDLINELRLIDAQESALVKRRRRVLDQLAEADVSTSTKKQPLAKEILVNAMNKRDRALAKRKYASA